MRRIRFPTIVDVFDAYPALETILRMKPSEEEPVAHIERALRAGRAEDVVDFCAFLLPRREAVWWACRCLAERDGGLAADDRPPWEAAAAWVRNPDERRRQAAFEICSGGDEGRATTWLLWAVAWSGGPMDPTLAQSVSAPPDLCGKALRNVVGIAYQSIDRADMQSAFVNHCVRLALEIARGERDIGTEAGDYLRARAGVGLPG